MPIMTTTEVTSVVNSLDKDQIDRFLKHFVSKNGILATSLLIIHLLHHPEMVLCQVACLRKYRICLSVGLCVCLYHHSGQTGRWISLKLSMMIGFDPT